jgi:hypothetical protein
MKNISIKIISLLVLITMTLSSCLNDLEDFLGQFGGSPAIAELSEAANPSTGTIVREIINPTVPAEFTLRVNIASANYFKTDVTVTLAIDNSLIPAFNTAHSTSAVAIPAAAIGVTSYDVVIPAGTREIDWTFSIDATKVPNPTSTFYILPVKIVSATNGVVVSGNYAEKYIRILARNKYDGKYTVTGSFYDFVTGTPPWVGAYPKHVNLITLGGDLVSKYDTDNSLYGYIFDTGAGLSQFGNWTPTFKFDVVTDAVIDVINSTFDAAPRSRTAALYTTTVAPAPAPNANKFFTSDHHIEVSYWLVQQTTVPVNRTAIVETYTYVGPR